ncbi:MAG: hypothetical protein GYB67_02365, partial [Chloroflexi bacterium]|nr:hypothetical protein [Chloroflexota bacterium]
MSRPHNVTDPVFRADCTIAAGAAVSTALDISAIGPRGLAVAVPAVWTAADIGFEVSVGTAPWLPLYDEAGDRGVLTGSATTAARLSAAPAAVWALGVYPRLRLVSLNTTTGAALNQG